MAALDIISNGLNVMINAQRKRIREVIFPVNKLMVEVVKILAKKRYISKYDHRQKDGKNLIAVILKYDDFGKGVVREVRRYSKSSRRVYANVSEIPRVKNGFATVILSTSRGVLTGKDARIANVGGEVICHIY